MLRFQSGLKIFYNACTKGFAILADFQYSFAIRLSTKFIIVTLSLHYLVRYLAPFWLRVSNDPVFTAPCTESIVASYWRRRHHLWLGELRRGSHQFDALINDRDSAQRPGIRGGQSKCRLMTRPHLTVSELHRHLTYISIIVIWEFTLRLLQNEHRWTPTRPRLSGLDRSLT